MQLSTIAIITMFVFFRSHMTTDLTHANYYMGALYYSIIIIILNGIPEMSMQIARLPSFYKQKKLSFLSFVGICNTCIDHEGPYLLTRLICMDMHHLLWYWLHIYNFQVNLYEKKTQICIHMN